MLTRWYPKGGEQPKHNDWQIIRAKVIAKTLVDEEFETEHGQVTLVGNMVAMEPDLVYNVQAVKEFNDKFQKTQYRVVYSQEIREFKTKQQVDDFLLMFLSPRQIQSLYSVHENPLEVIDSKNVEELCKASGIGKFTAESIIERYESCKDYGPTYGELGKVGITKAMIDKLIKHFKSADVVLHYVKNNPYELANCVDGIGFKKADDIALKNGIHKHDAKRIKAFIIHVLHDIADSYGSTYVSYDTILDKIDETLGTDTPQNVIDEVIDKLIDDKVLWCKDTTYEDGTMETKLALMKYYNIEKRIAQNIQRLLKAPNKVNLTQEQIDASIKAQEAKQGWDYTETQKYGVKVIADNNVVVVRGYGGTGKTSTVAGLLACLDEDYCFVQCALSGKASVNLVNITGREGYTIHRLLGFQPGSGFTVNKDNPLNVDMVILDEGSMVDISLAVNLLEAIPSGAKLVILGDSNQLEAIGAGNFFLDLIDSEIIPVVTFDKIHRQGAKSGIIPFSIDVANGHCKYKQNWQGEEVLGELQDLKMIGFNCSNSQEPKPSIDLIMREYKEMYNECKDISQITVVLPTNTRGTCTQVVNKLIQDFVQPKRRRGDSLEIGKGQTKNEVFRGDRILVLKNNYQLDIYNGNVGEVVSLDKENGKLVVDIYGKGEVELSGEALEHLDLGYAVSSHKCLTSDTVIFTNKGIKTLGELEPFPTVSGDYVEMQQNLKVYNGTYLETPSHFYNAGINKCLKFTTKYGYTITTTMDHYLNVERQGQILKLQAQDILPTDQLLVSLNNEIYGNNIQLPKEWLAPIKHDVRASVYKLPTTLTPTFARFLGFMTADGYLTHSGFSFGKQYKEVVVQFCKDVEELFGYKCLHRIYHIPTTIEGGLGMWKIECGSRYIKEFLKRIPGIQVHEKFVPDIIKQTTKENQCEYLKALFEDGSVGLNNGVFDHVELYLKDTHIINDVALMLLNMGIYTTRTDYGRGGLTLYIYKECASKFRDLIGFISNAKSERLRFELQHVERRTHFTNINDKLQPIRNYMLQQHKSQRNEKLYSRIKQSMLKQRTTLQLLLDIKQFCLQENLDASYYCGFEHLLNPNILFQPITNITETEEQCYCITMPETHQFIQNGFLGFNCQGATIPYLIYCIDYTHYVMLCKEQVYTGITRGKKKASFIFETRALSFAIKNSKVKHKQTFLYHFLVGDLNCE